MTQPPSPHQVIHPVILCGGSGTRLWPVSRKTYPKQFSDLLGPESLFQATLRRLTGPDFDAPLMMTHDAFRFIATEQAAAVGLMDAAVMIEPESRNTAPAVLIAALTRADEPEALMLVAPADHVIPDQAAFLAALRAGAAAAARGQIVTFGIPPDRPETGYGYLELAAPPAPNQAQPVRRFVEKPDAARAAEMLADGRYLWNSGIFLFRVGDILDAFAAHAPDLIPPCKAALAEGAPDLSFFRLGAAGYGQARDVSLDYAVMEAADNISVVPMACGWSDLGSWDALWSAMGPDAAGVATGGAVTALDCENVLLRSDDPNLHLVGLGLKDTVAVATRDAVLVADMAASQRVREAVNVLAAAQHPQATEFPRFHRPWGWYETLCLGPRFQVKRIMVKPGAKLSLQSHVHRAEHWVVVAGTALITVNDTETLLAENQSVYIPLGAVHRMENPGRVDMYLIEVQTGSYLGEDDIVRYEDVYARDHPED